MSSTFNVKQAAMAVLDACAICEHRHPSGCNYCDLDVMQPSNDPWWPEPAVKDLINVSSGEDAVEFNQ